MGTQRGQMKGVLSWPVPWACRAGTRDLCSPLASLVGPLQIGYDTKRCYATFLIQWQNIRELSKFSPVFTTPDKFY
jgi:hypothetical protein